MLLGKGILTNLQKEVLSLFPQIPYAPQFFLTGGTALSEFYLKHRMFYDLDFFTSQEGLIESFSETLSESLGKKGFEVQVTRRFQTFAEFQLSRGEEETIVHLAYDSPFRFSPAVDSVFGVKINDSKDIIAASSLPSSGDPNPELPLIFFSYGRLKTSGI